jgi:hypothetical protein
VLKFILQALLQSAPCIYEKKEGSEAGSGVGSGSIPPTNGSASGRPKNMRILRIRIPNTGLNKLPETFKGYLKVHKREKFFGSDFEFFTIL